MIANPNTPRGIKALETRALLLQTATREFKSQGYDAASMRGIAKAGGMSTGAIFSHWSGKDELYREATGRAPPSQEIVEALVSALRDVLPYAEASVGLPRHLWPQDSVILAAERAIAQTERALP